MGGCSGHPVTRDLDSTGSDLRLVPDKGRLWTAIVSVVGLAILCLLTFAAPIAGQGQNSQPDVGSISGAVVDEQNVPLWGAAVTARDLGGAATHVALTGEAGEFSFSGLHAGQYTLTASKAGFVNRVYGSRDAGEPAVPIAIGEGRSLTGLRLSLPAGAVIEGHITDPNHLPLAGVTVIAVERSPNGPKRAAISVTDDRGRYRLVGLAAGSFLVMGVLPALQEIPEQSRIDAPQMMLSGQAPSAPLRRLLDYLPVYFPGVVDAKDAVVVSLLEGQSASGIDFGVRDVRSAEVLGRIVDSAGRPAMTAQVSVTAEVDNLTTVAGDPRRRITTVRDGVFQFSLPPGRYSVVAVDRGLRPGGGAGGRQDHPVMWATTSLEVSGQQFVAVPTMRLEPGTAVFGDVNSPLSGSVADSRLLLALRPIGDVRGLEIPPVPVRPDGGFVFPATPPGEYEVEAFRYTGRQRQRLFVSAGDFGDTTVVVQPGKPARLTIRLTEPGEIGGRALASGGVPATECVLAVLRQRKEQPQGGLELFRAIRPATDGNYKFIDLPPGPFYLVAAGRLDRIRELLERPVAELETKAQGIDVRPGKRIERDLEITAGCS